MQALRTRLSSSLRPLSASPKRFASQEKGPLSGKTQDNPHEGKDRDRATHAEDAVHGAKHDKSPEDLLQEHKGGQGGTSETNATKVESQHRAGKAGKSHSNDPQAKAK